MRISRKRNKCYAFRSSAKESQATLCSFSSTDRRDIRGEEISLQEVIFVINRGSAGGACDRSRTVYG